MVASACVLYTERMLQAWKLDPGGEGIRWLCCAVAFFLHGLDPLVPSEERFTPDQYRVVLRDLLYPTLTVPHPSSTRGHWMIWWAWIRCCDRHSQHMSTKLNTCGPTCQRALSTTIIKNTKWGIVSLQTWNFHKLQPPESSTIVTISWLMIRIVWLQLLQWKDLLFFCVVSL